MNTLSRKEASQVIAEAYRLKFQYANSGSRLSQSIWWCCSNQTSTLPEELQGKLYQLVDQHRGSELDFYHWKDEQKVIQKFYELYVEEY